MADRNTEIEQLVLDPKLHIDPNLFPDKFWTMLSELPDVQVVELCRMLFVMLAKRIEGEAADTYSKELQRKSVDHVLDLFKESIR